MLGLIALVSLYAALRASREDGPAMGRELIVDLPLRVAADCQQQVRRFRQRKLKELLQTVPIYDKLLQDYPQARLLVRLGPCAV